MKDQVIRVSELEITEFRGFRNVTIQFDKPITVIIGQNGTAKSTLLGMLAQPFAFGKRATSKDESVYCSNYRGLSLGDYKDVSGRCFEYDCNQVFRLSKRYDTSDKRYLYSTKLAGIDFNVDKDSPLKSKQLLTVNEFRPKNREIRFVTGPGENGMISHNKGEGNFPHPVIYLSLGRLLPLAEVKRCDIDEMSQELSSEEKNWYIGKYKYIFSIVDENPTSAIMDTKEKKRSVIPVASYYDGESCSSGQDNVGRILTALLSFKRLKEILGARYRGGLLLIDEIDATLHPASQQKLMDVLIAQSNDLKLQVVLTSHSLFLVEVCSKSKLREHVGLVQLSKSHGNLEVRNAAIYEDMELDLKNAVGSIVKKEKHALSRASVLVEDRVAALFLKYLCKKGHGLLKKIKIINFVHKGNKIVRAESFSGNYLKILADNSTRIPELSGVIYVPDGDMAWTKKSHNPHVISLPGEKPLERLLFEMLTVIPKDDPFWGKCEARNYSKQSVLDMFCGSENPDMEEIKNWFRMQRQYWGKECEIALDRLYKERKVEFDEFVHKFEQIVMKCVEN